MGCSSGSIAGNAVKIFDHARLRPEGLRRRQIRLVVFLGELYRLKPFARLAPSFNESIHPGLVLTLRDLEESTFRFCADKFIGPFQVLEELCFVGRVDLNADVDHYGCRWCGHDGLLERLRKNSELPMRLINKLLGNNLGCRRGCSAHARFQNFVSLTFGEIT